LVHFEIGGCGIVVARDADERMSTAEATSPAARLDRLLEQTTRLHRLTAHLSTALHLSDVAEVVVDEGTTALDALSGALWTLDTAAEQLVLVRAKGYPDEALASVRRLPLDPRIPVADAVVRREPVWLSSRAEYEARYGESASRTEEMMNRPYSVAALPIVLREEVLGVLTLVFTTERPFDEDDRRFLTVLALHCAQGFERARAYAAERDARHAAEVARERAVFLARASALLASSLDYEETLRNVAALAVPKIGDWCGVELVGEDGVGAQVAVAHVDPAKVEYARELRRRYPPDRDSPTGAPNVLRTGVSEMYPEIPDEILVATARDEEHLRIARELGLRSVMIVPIKDRESVLGAISFVAAESGRRYTEDDLLMAEQLAERAGAAIANARLYETARAAIRVRDEFMLIAGHELRTPIAALVLHHDSLLATRDGTPLDKIRERAGKLRTQTERLARLVEDLLDVSRISAGRLVLEREEIDLGALARETAERMHDEFERARTPLHLDVAEVRGSWDRARLDQVLTNLLGNAVKYGKGSPVELRVQRDGESARIAVADQGIGVAPEDQLRIFKRFERAVSPRKFGGLGLGLWITSQLVEAHGGTIEVVSEPGAGATFVVVLPLAPPA
jgi:signal transduction histidine kinase